jgi:hypothetical protein
MAPLPQNSTPRFWLDYTDGSFQHSVMFRYAASAGLPAIMDVVQQFMADMAPSCCLLTVVDARASASGSNISLPVAWTGDATFGTGAQVNVNRPIEVRFEGRGPTGRRANWSLYGWDAGVPGAFRIPFDAAASIGDSIQTLGAAATAGTLLGIDGFPPVIYPYANIQYNSYWETKCRGG